MGKSDDLFASKAKVWDDKLFVEKKIYYTMELELFKLQLKLAKFDNGLNHRWRRRRILNGSFSGVSPTWQWGESYINDYRY